MNSDDADRFVKATTGTETVVPYRYGAAGSANSHDCSSDTQTVQSVGNRTQIVGLVLGTDNTTYHNATVSYGYDNLYRLTSEHRVPANPSANNPAFWYEYQYDPAGNRLLLTQKDEAGNVIGATASTYDAANKLLTAGNTSYTWDANGNQTAKTVNNVTTTYVWDFEDKMTQLHDGVTMTFTTDADGFRRSLTKDGATTYFLYERRSNIPGLDPLIAEVNAAGNATARYVHANGLLALRHEPSAISHWYHFEAIGSTRQLTEGNQVVTDTYAYEAFGNLAASAGATSNPYGYVGNYGYHNDGQSGLMQLGVRWYITGAGRFASRDPLRHELNLYYYAAGNPAAKKDPTGQSWKDVLDALCRILNLFCGPEKEPVPEPPPPPIYRPPLSGPPHPPGPPCPPRVDWCKIWKGKSAMCAFWCDDPLDCQNCCDRTCPLEGSVTSGKVKIEQCLKVCYGLCVGGAGKKKH